MLGARAVTQMSGAANYITPGQVQGQGFALPGAGACGAGNAPANQDEMAMHIQGAGAPKRKRFKHDYGPRGAGVQRRHKILKEPLPFTTEACEELQREVQEIRDNGDKVYQMIIDCHDDVQGAGVYGGAVTKNERITNAVEKKMDQLVGGMRKRRKSAKRRTMSKAKNLMAKVRRMKGGKKKKNKFSKAMKSIGKAANSPTGQALLSAALASM